MACARAPAPSSPLPDRGAQGAVQDYVRLSLGYLQAGDLAAARRHVAQALALDGAAAGALDALGLILQAEGELGLAERHFRRALERDPNASSTRNNLAALLFATGRYAEAVTQLDQVVADTGYPGRAVAFENLGRSLGQLGHPDAAGEALQRAVALNPGLFLAWLELARLHVGQEAWAEARECFAAYLAAAEANQLPHSQVALLTGIRIETWFGNHALAGLFVRMLQSSHGQSAAYWTWRAVGAGAAVADRQG